MSYTTILGLTLSNNSNSAIKEIKELHNSHGSAPVIWDKMCQIYLKTKPFSYHNEIDELWPLSLDLSIPEYQRAVLVMTYDKAYVSKDNYKRAANDIRKWLEEFPPGDEYINHWPEIALIYESNPNFEAIGLHCTSVTSNLFEKFDEETEEYLPDWDDSFEVYDEYK